MKTLSFAEGMLNRMVGKNLYPIRREPRQFWERSEKLQERGRLWLDFSNITHREQGRNWGVDEFGPAGRGLYMQGLGVSMYAGHANSTRTRTCSWTVSRPHRPFHPAAFFGGGPQTRRFESGDERVPACLILQELNALGGLGPFFLARNPEIRQHFKELLLGAHGDAYRTELRSQLDAVDPRVRLSCKMSGPSHTEQHPRFLLTRCPTSDVRRRLWFDC